jgi:spore germination protein YaaH
MDKKIIIIACLLAARLIGQEFKSIHQVEWEKYKNYPTHESLLNESNSEIIDLQTKDSQLNAAVFGYLPYWESGEYLQYTLLTHIALFGVNINSNGTLGNDHGLPWTSIINNAHAHGVKVIITAILFNGDDIHTLITTPSYKNTFFTNIKNKILACNADGVNIDFESLNNSDKGANIVNFMSDLTTYLHNEIPGSEVSYAGPAVNWGGYWDLTGLANACDYIFIMGYAFSGSWSTSSGPMAPLIGGSINITNTVNIQYGVVTQNNPQKLILGIPYYGYGWQTADGQPRSNVIAGLGSEFYYTYKTGADVYGEIWDMQSQTPWYKYFDGNDWHQFWCDNDSSLELKYDLALNANLKGVGMWALGYDRTRMELWYQLYEQFGGTVTLPPAKPEKLYVTIENSSELNVAFSNSPFADEYQILAGFDGLAFPQNYLVQQNMNTIQNLDLDSVYYLKVQAINDSAVSQQTEVLAAIPANITNKVLIVHGFDRNSSGNELKNYIRQHASAFRKQGLSFASCSNEAVISGKVILDDYEIVDWILGEESSLDETFNFAEQEKVRSYLQQGGKLFISGSEIGWDLFRLGATADQAFYADFLKAEYINDAPLGQSSTYYHIQPKTGEIFAGIPSFSFDNGSHGTYNVDWPDAITGLSGASNCLLYSGISENDGVAAICFDGFFPNASAPAKLVYFAFPFETVYPESARDSLMFRIIDFFSQPTSSIKNENKTLQDFHLLQNYPNPFNSQTKISYQIPTKGNVIISIFDVLGRKIRSWSFENINSGNHEIVWNGKNQLGKTVHSGTYFLKVDFNDSDKKVYTGVKKMIYLK